MDFAPPLLISGFALIIAVGTFIRGEERSRREKVETKWKRPRLSLTPISSVSEDQLREAVHVTVGLDYFGAGLMLRTDQTSVSTTQVFRVTNLSPIPLPNVKLSFSIDYYGGNLPYSDAPERDFDSVSLGSLPPNYSRAIVIASNCSFPVSVWSERASIEDEGEQNSLEIADNWTGYFRGEETVFRRQSILPSPGLRPFGVITNNPVESRHSFLEFKNRGGKTLGLLTLEQSASSLDVIFTHTGYGGSPVNQAEEFIEAFEKQKYRQNLTRRYFAHFSPHPNNERRLIELLNDRNRRVEFAHPVYSYEAGTFEQIDGIIGRLRANFDPISKANEWVGQREVDAIDPD